MSANKASVIIDEVAFDLFDPTNVRWSEATLINYMNRGMRDIADKSPAASVSIQAVPVVAGAQQTITGVAKAKFLLAIEHLQFVDNASMDAEDPAWKLNTLASDNSEAFVYDRNNPTVFWLYPPRVTAGAVTAQLAVDPTEIVDKRDTLTISDAYIPALYNYIMAAALAREGETQNLEKANTYLQMYNAAVGG